MFLRITGNYDTWCSRIDYGFQNCKIVRISKSQGLWGIKINAWSYQSWRTPIHNVCMTYNSAEQRFSQFCSIWLLKSLKHYINKLHRNQAINTVTHTAATAATVFITDGMTNQTAVTTIPQL